MATRSKSSEFAELSDNELMDYFAALAMQGWIAIQEVEEYGHPNCQNIASWAYLMADAMIKERAK